MNDLQFSNNLRFWTFDVDVDKRNVRLEKLILTFQIQNCVEYVLNKETVNKKFVTPEEVLAEVLKKAKSIAEVQLT